MHAEPTLELCAGPGRGQGPGRARGSRGSGWRRQAPNVLDDEMRCPTPLRPELAPYSFDHVHGDCTARECTRWPTLSKSGTGIARPRSWICNSSSPADAPRGHPVEVLHQCSTFERCSISRCVCRGGGRPGRGRGRGRASAESGPSSEGPAEARVS